MGVLYDIITLAMQTDAQVYAVVVDKGLKSSEVLGIKPRSQ